MKSDLKHILLSTLLCVVFTAEVRAQLPNAWQINDNLTAAGFIQYVTNLTNPQYQAAVTYGWRYTLVSRMVSDSGSAASHSMAFGTGSKRFYIFFDLDSSSRLTAQLLGDTNYTLTSAAEGTNYHTHELQYDPLIQMATYRFDGADIASWAGENSSGQSQQVMWGANSSTGRGVMNYHRAEFEIMGLGVIASYEAGFDGNPAAAPSPTNQAWTRYTTGVIPEGAVSPDAVALPPLATTLAASDVWAHHATLNALLQTDGLTTEYHFEHGPTTNYGSFTATNTLVDGAFVGVFSNVVNGLLPDSTYHFRVVASNSTGEVIGQDMSFTTSLTTVVSSLADSGPGTLRAAVEFANTNVAGTDITFDPALAGQTIVLTSGELLLTNSASLDASALSGGIAISGNHNSRILFMLFATATLDSLTLTNGNDAVWGGGIFFRGTLTLNNCTLTGNTAGQNGGCIYSFSSSLLTLNNCILSGNSTTDAGYGDGAGIYNSFGTVKLNNSTLSNNAAAKSGGGVYSLVGTLTLNNSNLTGNSAARSGGGIYVYDHSTSYSGTVTLDNSTLTGNSAPYGGGGIYIDSPSDISPRTVTVNNCTLSGNTATDVNYGSGGGIYNDGTLTINSSTFAGNTATDGSCIYNNTRGSIILNNSTLSGNSGSPGYHGGGGIYNDGDITVSNSIFSGNSTHYLAFGGGGIYNDANGSIVLNDSTLTGNTTGLTGGGIYNGGTLTINSSTLSGNSASRLSGSSFGGGVYNASGTVTINNSTLSGNSATNLNDSSSGGGVYNAQGTVAINNSTLSGNSATNLIGSSFGGGVYNARGTVRLTNSIVAGNSAASSANIYGSFSASHCLTNGDPLLAPLGDYGGPTQTMPPLAGSPAIDAGLDSVTTFIATDQRGYPRLSGTHVDIGAVEAQFAPANNRPVIRNSSVLAGGALSFNFTNVPNADFTVLATTNLALTLSQWIILAPAIQGSPGQYQFTDIFATNYPQRFYRVVSP